MPEPERQSRPNWALWLFLFLGGGYLNLLAQYVIPLDTRTKKNSMSIAGTGPRCPKCGKRQKQFIRQGHANTEYSAMAAKYLVPKPRQPISCKVHIVYRIYTQTRRVVDDLNLYASLDDILVKEKILKDDNRNIIRCRDGSGVFYDKDHPRAEIYLYEFAEEEEEEWRHLTQKCLP